MNELKNTDIRFLKGIGEKKSQFFRRLGIETVWDLLTNYPRTYEDWSTVTAINDCRENDVVAIKAITVTRPVPIRTRTGKIMYRTCATDGKGMINLTFFNNRYVVDDLKENEEFIFFGKIKINDMGGKEMLSPRYEKAEKSGYLHPVYNQTKDLNSKAIAKAVRTALDTYSDKIKETLPSSQIMKYKLLSLYDAIKAVHFPRSEAEIKAARRRLIYEELLILQLGILSQGRTDDEKAGCIIENDCTEEFISALPFLSQF